MHRGRRLRRFAMEVVDNLHYLETPRLAAVIVEHHELTLPRYFVERSQSGDANAFRGIGLHEHDASYWFFWLGFRQTFYRCCAAVGDRQQLASFRQLAAILGTDTRHRTFSLPQ